MYTVTRQLQWPDNEPVVEVSYGGLDFTNPNALCEKYDGEFEEFKNPVEAVETAVEICEAWRKDGEKGAQIGIGATGGMVIPFEPCSFETARKWAQKESDSLEKCPTCGEIVEDLKEWYLAGIFTENDFFPYDDGFKYCSEHCAEKASEFDNLNDIAV